MPEILSDIEIRVLGALVEKAITTPEYYPLTLNALINACNQKSNRDPVVSYDGQTVGNALTSLKEKALTRIVMGGDSRVPKYQQYFAEAYDLNPAEEAILCELMLRGPQTVGELRARTERLNNHQQATEVEATLEGLVAREMAIRLPRQPGRKESRYAHLLAGQPIISEEEPQAEIHTKSERLTVLEDEVQTLRQELAALQQQFVEFKRQFE